MASVLDTSFDTIGHGMLQAFRERLKATLVEQAIATIRPNIEAAAEQAVRELQARVDSSMDARLQRTTIALILQWTK